MPAKLGNKLPAFLQGIKKRRPYFSPANVKNVQGRFSIQMSGTHTLMVIIVFSRPMNKPDKRICFFQIKDGAFFLARFRPPKKTGLSAPSPRICPGCMGEQRFCFRKIATSRRKSRGLSATMRPKTVAFR
jgi:hypothetical protein